MQGDGMEKGKKYHIAYTAQNGAEEERFAEKQQTEKQ